MPDVYTRITEAAPETVEVVGRVMEVSAADPQHLAMVHAYLDEVTVAADAHVVEVGAGTGAISREIARRFPHATVLGLDPSPGLVQRARELAAGLPQVDFQVADGAALPLPDGQVDLVVIHRVLCHVPDPEAVLAEASRVLKGGGVLAAFGGDYATITLDTGPHDPLGCCVAAFWDDYVHDPWLVRRLPALVRAAGFTPRRMRSHGVVQVDEPEYMLSIADRGADALRATGRIGEELASALKAEARSRVQAHRFFGHIAYASLVADLRPDDQATA
jgi:SAM-dependent methyltransferase